MLVLSPPPRHLPPRPPRPSRPPRPPRPPPPLLVGQRQQRPIKEEEEEDYAQHQQP